MSSSPAPLTTFNSAEPIPGYTVRRRIGAGGYGEVWEADAPGGLIKAVKFVYGHLDDLRASRELKALNRIKEVRHPFLLSLERIEVVDNHLVIVTELAEQSLKDRAAACREAGLPGIPREELLLHLQDAADALDYICEHHSLQHLDVKPENLLLVGGRVKVADFGLVKDIFEGGVSLLSGLTPEYAPPEVFDGRPNRHSDQYSLAIVYQQLLTREFPFNGRTTAQLAAQHLHSRPRLQSLPAHDRGVIERALSKDPELRFESCRELVAALLAAPHQEGDRTAALAGRGWSRPGNGGDEGQRPRDAADVDARASVVIKTRTLTSAGSGRPAPSVLCETGGPAEIVDLPAVEPEESFALRPTLLLGLGGAAGAMLRRAKRRLQDRFGDLDQVPAVQLLLVDTDLKALHDATLGDEMTALRTSETFGLPLRSSTDYRAQAPAVLQWLSRRWLYNIPRSLQTEGLRPLGRLALVDRASELTARLREALSTAIDPDSLAASTQATGREFRPGPPRVLLLAAVSGGAASGMLIDVGYLLRSLLADLGLTDDGLTAILTHATARNAQLRDLALSNAYACLSELYHFSRGNAYPGDAGSGLPAFAGGVGPFQSTYLVHLGDDLSDEQFAAGAEDIAEYVYHSTVTGAGAWFEACRRQAVPVDGSPSLRTFGLAHLAAVKQENLCGDTEALCRAVVQRWRGAARPTVDDNLARGDSAKLATAARPAGTDQGLELLAEEQARGAGLATQPMVDAAYEAARRAMEVDPEQFFAEALAEAATPAPRGESGHSSVIALLDAVNALVNDAPADESAQPVGPSLEVVLHRQLRKLARAQTDALCGWIWELVDQSTTKVKGAQRAAQWFLEHLRQLEAEIGELVQPVRAELRGLEDALLAPVASEGARKSPASRSARASAVDPRVLNYARLRWHEVTLRAVLKQVGLVRVQVTATADQLRDLWKDLTQLADQFAAATEAGPAAEGPRREESWRPAADLITAVSQELDAEYLSAQGGLRRVLTLSAESRGQLAAALRVVARRVLRRTRRDANLAQLLEDLDGPAPEGVFRDCVLASQPRLAAVGGSRRRVLLLRESGQQESVREQFERCSGSAVRVECDADADVTLVTEMEQLSLRRVAALLAASRADCARLAARLHTRVDIAWSPIPSEVPR
jgi:hypothetical protein